MREIKVLVAVVSVLVVGLLIGYYLGHDDYLRDKAKIADMQVEIKNLQAQNAANSRYVKIVEKERDQAIRQRDLVVQTLDSIFNTPPRRQRPNLPSRNRSL